MLKMIDLFGSIRSLFKVHRIAEDSMIFRLHYRATVAVLLAGCLTLACKSISGSPIHCEATAAVDKAVLETFCWLHTTYSMVRAFNMSIGQAVPYPGVSNTKGEGGHGHAPHPLVKQHKYYQWVIFFLLLQVRSDNLFLAFLSIFFVSPYTFLYLFLYYFIFILSNYIIFITFHLINIFCFIIVLISTVNISMIELKNIGNFHNKYYFSFIFMCEILFLLRATTVFFYINCNVNLWSSILCEKAVIYS